MQQVVGMCSSFEATKSTKGASKLRRDLINGEIANLRDLLPLPSSTRQRLSQLQLMALVCVYVRKSNYFQQVLKRHPELGHPYAPPHIGFSKALSGFLIMMTQNGKLLYISDNAAEYLGHSMEDLLIHGDSVYDIIDKADHGTVQAELLRSSNAHNPPGEDARLFLCRMNVSRNARRQMRFGDQKVVLVEGHFLSYLPLCSRNEPVFVAVCTPVAMPETRECVVQGATNVFTSIHAIDMKFMHMDRNGEHYLGYTRSDLAGMSWYQLIHWQYMREAQSKHRLICQSDQEKSCILLLRLQTRSGEWIWVHCVLQVKDGADAPQSQQSVIVATNQVLSEREAAVMRANSWIYHYYTVQTKLQYGLAYADAQGTGPTSPSAAVAAARLAAAAYFPTTKLMNHPGGGGGGHQTTPPYPFYGHHHHHHHQASGHPAMSPDSSGGYTPMPLHSPHHHNGVYTPAHPFHHTFDLRHNGKESPLDFSLAAAAAASSAYELPMAGGYPSPGYWTHHPHYHGYTSSTGRMDEGSTVLSTIAASAGSPHSWSTTTTAAAVISNNSSSAMQHHSHHHHHNHHQQPIHHQASLTTPPNNSNNSSSSSNNNSTTMTTPSPAGSSVISVSSGKRAKRMRKNVEVVGESELSGREGAARASVDMPSIMGDGDGGAFRITGSRGYQGGGGGGGSTDIMLMAAATPFTFHTRSRKMLGSTTVEHEDEHVSVEEDSMTMACPLTPSPIWEGQTHRVPDLQLYSCNSSSSSSGNAQRDESESVTTNNTDLTHRVPTMDLWNHHHHHHHHPSAHLQFR